MLFWLSDIVNINTIFGDKGYIGKLEEELKQERGIKLYALKRSNSKNPLPKDFRNLISKYRRRIETTFNQLIEHFNIERVRANSILGLYTMLEIKFLCFNILSKKASYRLILILNILKVVDNFILCIIFVFYTLDFKNEILINNLVKNWYNFLIVFHNKNGGRMYE